MSGSDKLSESQRDKAPFRESEEHYRAVAEAATDAIITIDKTRDEAVAAGAIAFLKKPVKEEVLLGALESALKRTAGDQVVS